MRRRYQPGVPEPDVRLRFPRYAKARSSFERQWLLLKRQYGGAAAAVWEAGPYVLLPAAVWLLWITEGALVTWAILFAMVAARYALRSHRACGLADKLLNSGIVLLPEDDEGVVAAFLAAAEAAHVEDMVHSLHEGAAVTLLDVPGDPTLQGRCGVVEGFYHGEAVVAIDGGGGRKLVSPEALSQVIDIGGRPFAFTRRI